MFKFNCMTKSDRDNHANQLNRNNGAYWQSRGCNERPNELGKRADRDTPDTDDDPNEPIVDDDWQEPDDDE